jgi:hypothetical protein
MWLVAMAALLVGYTLGFIVGHGTAVFRFRRITGSTADIREALRRGR